jgi:hypothetical protein
MEPFILKLFDLCWLLAVLHGCVTCSLVLMKGYRLQVLNIMMLKRISVPLRKKTIGEWKNLHKDEYSTCRRWSRSEMHKF